MLTLEWKVTNKLYIMISLKKAERSEAKIREAKLRDKNLTLRYFDAKLCFALLASLRSALLARLYWTTNLSFSLQGLTLYRLINKLCRIFASQKSVLSFNICSSASICSALK